MPRTLEVVSGPVEDLVDRIIEFIREHGLSEGAKSFVVRNFQSNSAYAFKKKLGVTSTGGQEFTLGLERLSNSTSPYLGSVKVTICYTDAQFHGREGDCYVFVNPEGKEHMQMVDEKARIAGATTKIFCEEWCVLRALA